MLAGISMYSYFLTCSVRGRKRSCMAFGPAKDVDVKRGMCSFSLFPQHAFSLSSQTMPNANKPEHLGLAFPPLRLSPLSGAVYALSERAPNAATEPVLFNLSRSLSIKTYRRENICINLSCGVDLQFCPASHAASSN